MPAMFSDLATFLLCAAIMFAAQVIYATVGFGAGMFAVALLALVLPDLVPIVVVLLLLTLVTEVWVLTHAWRHARGRLLLALLPPMAVGMWLGTNLLVHGDAEQLKRVLGGVVAAAGLWFLLSRRPRAAASDVPQPLDGPAGEHARPRERWWLGIPMGLLSGVLGGTFGTGGPPVIVFLRAYGLPKGPFRATILWYFLIMSGVRLAAYLRAGIMTPQHVYAAAWLLPASVAGILTGMWLHRQASERQFAQAVSLVLTALGVLLLAGLGR